MKDVSNPQPTAPATSFRSAGVNPSRFIFWENACGLLPQRLANSETLIPSFTHKILICSDVGTISPLLVFNINVLVCIVNHDFFKINGKV
jgi:hypothetical protein